MNSELLPGERGLLLLCSQLGDKTARPLTPAEYRRLWFQVLAADRRAIQPDADLRAEDLLRIGCNPRLAYRTEALLEREEQLDDYLAQLARGHIRVLTRLSPGYPRRLAKQLGLGAPMVLFYTGDPALFQCPAVAVVGSRDLRAAGRAAAQDVGELLARCGYALCSGGAAGADETAARACLDGEGSVVCYLAGNLVQEAERQRAALTGGHLLLTAAEAPDAAFSARRALERNRYIHAHGLAAVVCQSSYGKGGTWRGALENLKAGWSPVYVADDGSEGARGLLERGAQVLDMDALASWLETGPVPR